MNTLVGSTTGLIHLLSGVVAILVGGVVLVSAKGSQFHRRAGYVYVASMAVLIISSLGIYRLYGHFGPFHIFSLVATFSLVAGMRPILKKQRTPADYETHFKRMYFSVVGLYAAFAAESFVRIPQFGGFWAAVAWGMVLVFVTCFIIFIRMRPVWSKRFGKARAGDTPAPAV